MGYTLLPKWLFWVVVVVFVLHVDESRGCIQKEKLALLQIKKHLTSLFSHQPYLLPSWKDESFAENCCLWERVKCDPSSTHIIELSLGSVEDSSDDDFPPTTSYTSLNLTVFQDLEHLKTLDLSSNYIKNLVEDEGMCKLRSLEVLDLSKNFNLDGEIPNCVGNLGFLEKLDLSSNSFTGNIPLGICNLKGLQRLDLSQNNLNGSLPICIYDLSSLEYLSLMENYLMNGSIRSEICNLKKLQALYLSFYSNIANGGLPLCIYNMSSIEYMSLAGRIPSEVCNLKRLTGLSLFLSGSLPGCIGNLNSLQYLYLYSNGSSGSIDSAICKLAKLESLRLEYSQNNLPSCLGNLTSLQELIISDSDFSLVPTGLCTLMKLQVLHLRNNTFNGILPACIGKLTSLTHLILLNNQFTGSIPSTISNLTSLEDLSMIANSFEGKFSLSLLSQHANLRDLYIIESKLEIETEDRPWTPSFQLLYLSLTYCSINKKTKAFPKFLSHQHSLLELYLHGNGLVGSFPASLVQCNSQHENNISSSRPLQYLDLASNMFSGKLPENFGSVLSNLKYLRLSGNSFEGQLPATIGEIKGQLQYLDLSSNRFSGMIPSCIYTISSLRYLYLSNNSFSGHVSDDLSTSSSLTLLDVRGNRLVGDIPLSIGKLSMLAVLQLGNNKLQGRLPTQLCHLKYLNILDVANNEISGMIPSCLKDMSFGLIDIYFSDATYLDFITKGRHINYVALRSIQMSGLDLSCNQLSGHIPPDLGDLKGTQSLNLSHNKLNGLIPRTFSMLSNIESLDLSYNNLTGSIPVELVKLNFLEVFNVSYNNLSGRVPITGQFGTFGASSYEGNPFLFGYDQGRNSTGGESLNPSFETNKEDTGFDWRIFFWSFGPSCIIFLVGSIMVVYCNPQWLNACLFFSIDARLYYWFLSSC